MATAIVEESKDEDENFYEFLGGEQNVSNEAIELRPLSKEGYSYRNMVDYEKATRDYQNVTYVNINLLPPEKRRKHEEDLIGSGTRNEKALPLPCSICSKHSGRYAARCLKGFGHKSPLIEEFLAAQSEYEAQMHSQQNEEPEFAECLEKVLQNFVKNEFPKLYPLANAPNRRQRSAAAAAAADLKQDSPLPSFVNDVLKQCYLSMTEETSDETEVSSLPTASEVADVLRESQTRPSRRRDPTNLSLTNKFPMYDMSTLSDKELGLILDYLRLPYETSANREVLENMANRYCPMVVLLPNFDDQSLNQSKECGRCSSQLSLIETYFRTLTSTVCFACNHVCCGNCLIKTKWKVPSSGSFDLRTICSECLRVLKIYESQSWLERGIALIESDQNRKETVLAMYRISNAVRPSDVAIIQQAKLLYERKEYTTLTEFGKAILLNESLLTKDNRTVLLYLVVDSQLQVVGAMPDTDFINKVELYEDAINWIERFDTLVDERINNLKLKAIQTKSVLLNQRDEILKKKAAMVWSHLTEAIKEGLFLEALHVIDDEKSDKEVMQLCWQQLLKESNENYNEYSRLLLRLLKATALHEQGNSTAAMNEVADVFWNGFELFLSSSPQDRVIPIIEYVVHFTFKLIINEASLPLENLAGINVSNFLSTLQITEEDLINPPDIDDRKWENLNVEDCDVKMFLKYEKAVKTLVERKKWRPLDAALAYYDLITACKHPAQLLLTIITSAQWFTRQISCSDSSESCRFACKKMITTQTDVAAAVAFEFSTQPYMQYYVAKMVIALQFYSSLKTGHQGQMTAKLIGMHMKWLVAAGRNCPLHKMPIVTPTEAVLMNIISSELHHEYLLMLQDAVPPELRPMSEAILRYQIYENCWLKRGVIVDLTDGGLRFTAMAALLAEKKWSWDDVQRHLVSNMIALDRNGWRIVNGKLMDTVESNIPGNIHRLVGLEINKKDFDIRVLVERPSPLNVFNRQPALLTWGDIAVGLSLSQPGVVFNFTEADPRETPYHPFYELIYSPEQLEGTEMLFTMLHTDYLLKQFSMGHEIQSYPPFQVRPTSEGLLKNLPEDLKVTLRSIPSRGASRNRVHRLWIQADTMEIDVQETGDTIRWLFGEVKIAVRCMPMLHGEDGELKDINTDRPDPDSPEGRFVEDFTKNYDKIGKYFPEFLRLKELCKVQWLGKFLDSLKESMEEHKEHIKSGRRDSLVQNIQDSLIKKREASIASNLDKKRNDIKRRVSKITDNVVNQVQQQGSISASRSEISNWLHTGNSHDIAKKIARENAPSLNDIRRDIVQMKEVKLGKCTSVIENLRKSSKKFFSPSNKCKWIPAVYCSQVKDQFIRLHYGGVSLRPKVVKTDLSTSRFFSGISKIALTPALLSNCAPKKQLTPPAFNPPKVNAIFTMMRQRSANTRNTQASRKDEDCGGPSGSGTNCAKSGSSGRESEGGGREGEGSGKSKIESGGGLESGGEKEGDRSGGDSSGNKTKKPETKKRFPKTTQYVKPLSPGKSDWETALSEFNTAFKTDVEVSDGKTTAAGSGWDTLKSSLEKVQRGEKPPRGFSLVHSMTGEGQKWLVRVRSSKDKRPMMEFYRKGIQGKMAEKRIRIRFGGKQS
ncbi:uncharacterized protein LOC114519233 [Dendronephthya gigantea]|uniref:uncharacterized protein LOC114519233 n=1 Tax=Dendronephthya gigantea TaxID=151771 RepID=UPI00106D1432|nr:uncharacterized protein LOC114519233 [Dendronephthya gigantea]XP_028395129.1 uncharacterized protein LOC114519233 [Dendronephthya gigantea]